MHLCKDTDIISLSEVNSTLLPFPNQAFVCYLNNPTSSLNFLKDKLTCWSGWLYEAFKHINRRGFT